MIDHKLSYDARNASNDLNVIYDNAEIGASFVLGQSEANQATSPGTIHLVMINKVNANYGAMYEFQNKDIYFRNKSSGTWSSWKLITDDTNYQGDGSFVAGSKWTIDDMRIVAVGKAVMVHLLATATQNYGSSDVIATIGETSVRPIYNYTRAMLFHLTRDNAIALRSAAYLTINTDGTITQSYTASNGTAGDKIEALFYYKI